MKKIKKNDLRLDKEVISSLSGNELNSIKGGYNSNEPGVECFRASYEVRCDSKKLCLPTRAIECVIDPQPRPSVKDICKYTDNICLLMTNNQC